LKKPLKSLEYLILLIFFLVPSSATTSAIDRKTLGLLAHLVSNTCLLEPFRNQPNKAQARDCILKLFSLHGELQRKAKRSDSQYLTDEELPFLRKLAPKPIWSA
jgi:hypothetical protein